MSGRRKNFGNLLGIFQVFLVRLFMSRLFKSCCWRIIVYRDFLNRVVGVYYHFAIPHLFDGLHGNTLEIDRFDIT